MSSYVEWEQSVTELIAEELQVSYGDAAGIIEAQPFYMQQSWGNGMDAHLTAAKVMEAVLAETKGRL